MPLIDVHEPGDGVTAFLQEYHLASLSLITTHDDLHVTPVGFTYEPASAIARVITWAGSRKARHFAEGGELRATLCSVDGGRWLALEGLAHMTDEPDAVAEGVRRYAERYRQPKDRDDRVVIELSVTKILGRA